MSSANSTASGRGSTVVRSTTAPSAFETIFWVTTRTSSSRSGSTPPVALERVAEDRREVVARDDLRDPVEGDDLDPSVGRPGQRASAAPVASDSTSSRSSGVSMSRDSGPSSST